MSPKDAQLVLGVFQGIGIIVVTIFLVVGIITILDKLLD